MFRLRTAPRVTPRLLGVTLARFMTTGPAAGATKPPTTTPSTTAAAAHTHANKRSEAGGGSSSKSSSPQTAAAAAPPPPPPPSPSSSSDNAAADKRTAEDIRIAEEVGAEAFEENTQILKSLAARGLRAFVVCALGLGMFSYAMKRKKRETEAASKKDEDPTERYLEEMRGLGFDVDTLEDELKEEKQAKKKAPRSIF